MSRQRTHTRLERQKSQESEQKPVTSRSTAPESVYDVLESDGQSLDSGTRAFMEPRFGHDFGLVRIHADGRAAGSASDIEARAYTLGNDIVFGIGEYAPATSEGQHLLAHELTHVVQQRAFTVQWPVQIGEPGSRTELEAESVASSISLPVMASTVAIAQHTQPAQIQRQSHHGDEHAQPARPSAPRVVHVPPPPAHHLSAAQIQQLNQQHPPLLRLMPPGPLRVEPQVTPEPLQFRVNIPVLDFNLLRLRIGSGVEFDLFNEPGVELDFSRSLVYPQDFSGAQACVNLFRLHLGRLIDVALPGVGTGVDSHGNPVQQVAPEVDIPITDLITAIMTATFQQDGSGRFGFSSFEIHIVGRF